MRLHRLELIAFGPFADRQQVDFDRLSAAGLFLLHGPTGAGKTSVLDAICFALYGRVPGARGGVNRLRSDHAADHVAPEVVCEFSVSGRRFEVTRSPQWQRPKKRGGGTVLEPAHVVLRERVGAGWNPLTNRVDEAADLLHHLLGLGAEQFTKLILLPQGEFAAFLRAGAEERRPLLQTLFGTDRFAEVERWLADRRRELEHQVRVADTITARLFARAQEARLGSDEVDGDPPPPAAAAAAVSGWAEAANAERGAATVEVHTAEQAYEKARQAATDAAEAVRQQHRRAELSTELDHLLTGTEAQQHRRAEMTAAGHARVLAPLLTDLRAAEQLRNVADQRWTRARAEAQTVGADPETATAEHRAALGTELGALTELLGLEADANRLDAQHSAAERDLQTADADRASTEIALADLAAASARLVAERTAAELIAVTEPDRKEDAARARAVAQAVQEHQHLVAAQARAQDELREAIDVHQGAVDTVQELRARRLAGMAAELAAGLAADRPCPVCGSGAHPAPAAHRVSPVTESTQRRAEAAQKLAETNREAARGVVQAGRQRLAALSAVAAGQDAESAAAELARTQAAVVQARSAGERAARLVTEVTGLADRREQVGARLAAALAQAGSSRETLAAISARRVDLHARREQARGDDLDLASRQQRLSGLLTALNECAQARQEQAAAQDRADRAGAVLDRAAAEAGFVDRAAATAAIRSDDEIERLAEAITEHDARVARLRALLDEAARPSVEPEPDRELLLELDFGPGLGEGDPAAELERLRAIETQTRHAHQRARERHTLADRAVRALGGLALDLSTQASETAPLRSRFADLEAVSKCVEGTGGDNTLRMRLSSYVLAARLEQVAEAASLRLTAMSGGRYLLAHTDGPARGGARSGLGLAVIDGWTGIQRDPASLSGGETFCTSLALALGLADVVQAEAGGSVIETLLVDEGFGSLDEQTLDEVMDVLDGLRSAGRSVGLVSHVSDLRDRIPTRLEVVKTRTGSRLIA